jgi:hypothetical protein
MLSRRRGVWVACALALVVGLVAVQHGTAPRLLSQGPFGVAVYVTGGGQFEIPGGILVPFYFDAMKWVDGSAGGQFEIYRPDTKFVYRGMVTCMAVDTVTNRAWVGGIVTYSNDPSELTQPGDDVWFRVVDYGWSSVKPDRSTVYGFKGAAGFDTSDQYCAGRPWPDDDARTWPVKRGAIHIYQTPWGTPGR